MANETIKVTAQGEDNVTPVFKQIGITIVTIFKRISRAALSLGAALGSIFALSKAGTFLVSLAKSTGVAAAGFSLFRGILSKIPGISIKASKSLALITGSSVALTKASIFTKQGIDKLSKAISSVSKGKLSLTPKGLRAVGKAAVSTAQGVILLNAGVSNLRSGFGPLGKVASTLTRQLFSMRTAFIALAGIGGIVAVGKSSVAAAAQMEDFETRLIALTKSEEIAAQKLRALSEFAARAPFELPAIIEAGVTLEAFGVKAEAGIEPLGDLAAFMGVDIVMAAQSMGRAFAAGAGAADVLRERGVLNLVSMRTGIDDLTKLSLPEFRKALIESMTDPAGKIAGATQRLAKTFTGQMSMMSDATFQLRRNFGEALIPILKDLVTNRLVPLIKELTKWVKVNKLLISQKFDRFIKSSVKATKDFLKWVTKIVPKITAWWKENKELIFTLTKLLIITEIAIKVSALVIALTGLGKTLTGLKLLFSKTLIQLAGAGGLLTAVSTLAPQILILAGAFALLLGFGIGSFISDWVSGIDKLKQATKEAGEEQDKLQIGLSSRLQKISRDTGILVTNMDSFNAAVEEGLLVFDKAAGVWTKGAAALKKVENAQKEVKTQFDFGKASIKGQKEALDKLKKALEQVGVTDLEKLKTQLEKELKLLKGNKDLEFKALEAHEQRIRKLRDKSFNALGIVSKEQVRQRLTDALQNFKNVVKTQDLTDREVIRLREGLFNTMKNIAEAAGGETKIALGFDPKTVLEDVKQLHQNLLDSSSGTADLLLTATGEEVNSLNKAFEVQLTGYTKNAKSLTQETVAAVSTLITSLEGKQKDTFGKLITEIDKYKNAYITAEQEITKVINIETENRLGIFKRFIEEAGRFRLEAGAFDLPISGATGGITPVGDSSISNSNTNNNQQFNVNINGTDDRIGVEESFNASRSLRQLQQADASLTIN